MANGTMSSGLISPDIVKRQGLVDTFIYLRTLRYGPHRFQCFLRSRDSASLISSFVIELSCRARVPRRRSTRIFVKSVAPQTRSPRFLRRLLAGRLERQ